MQLRIAYPFPEKRYNITKMIKVIVSLQNANVFLRMVLYASGNRAIGTILIINILDLRFSTQFCFYWQNMPIKGKTPLILTKVFFCKQLSTLSNRNLLSATTSCIIKSEGFPIKTKNCIMQGIQNVNCKNILGNEGLGICNKKYKNATFKKFSACGLFAKFQN